MKEDLQKQTGLVQDYLVDPRNRGASILIFQIRVGCVLFDLNPPKKTDKQVFFVKQETIRV